jgi:dTDP-4-dehydrorhamnose reductase
MSYLVLGAGGQLGREWKRYLEKQNTPYKAYGSSKVDITDQLALFEAFNEQQPDVVVNCAAYTDVDGAEDHANEAREINIEAVEDIANFCSDFEATLIHYSTDYVFPGRAEDEKTYPDGYPESLAPAPINAYGQSKLAGEEKVQQSNADYLIIRASWLCGQFGSNFVKTMLNLAHENDQLQVVNDQRASPSFARNVVENSDAILKSKQRGIYHVASDGLLSWYDFATEIFRQAEIEVEVEPVSSDEFPQKAKRPAFSKLSIEKLHQISDNNIIHWKDGLRHLLATLL